MQQKRSYVRCHIRCNSKAIANLLRSHSESLRPLVPAGSLASSSLLSLPPLSIPISAQSQVQSSVSPWPRYTMTLLARTAPWVSCRCFSSYNSSWVFLSLWQLAVKRGHSHETALFRSRNSFALSLNASATSHSVQFGDVCFLLRSWVFCA